MEINEKKLEKVLENQRKEYQKYLGVLKEDFNGKVKIIAKQYTDIRKTLTSHLKMLALLQEDIEIIKVDIEFIKNSLKKKVDFEGI